MKQHHNLFTGLLTLARHARMAPFDIGDELLRVLGPPNETRDDDAIRAAAAFLEENGVDEFGPSHLQRMRMTANVFPPERRHKHLSYMHHVVGGKPDILDGIVKGWPKGKKLTVQYVQQLRQRAEARHVGGKELPAKGRGFSAVPDPRDIETLVYEVDTLSKAHRAAALADNVLEELNERLEKLDGETLAAFAEVAGEAIEKWERVKDAALKRARVTRSHLSVVTK